MKKQKIIFCVAAIVVAWIMAASCFIIPSNFPINGDGAWKRLLFIAEMPRENGSDRIRVIENYIKDELEVAGIKVEIIEFETQSAGGETVTVRNIAAEIPGRDASPILFMAHYDSGVGTAGAGDNGMSVASLLEAATSIAGGENEQSVKLLFTDAEELGLLGARCMIGHPFLQGITHVFNLEGMGNGPFMPIEDTGLSNFYLKNAKSKVGFSAIAAFGGYAMKNRFDTQPFRDNGYKVMTLATVFGQMEYHTPDDDLEHADKKSLEHTLNTIYSLLNAATDSTSDTLLKGDANKNFFMLVYGVIVNIPWQIFLFLLFATLSILVFMRKGEMRLTLKATGILIALTISSWILFMALFRLVSFLTWNRLIQIGFDNRKAAVLIFVIDAICLVAVISVLKGFVHRLGSEAMINGLILFFTIVALVVAIFLPEMLYLFAISQMILLLIAIFHDSHPISVPIYIFVISILFAPLLILLFSALKGAPPTIIIITTFTIMTIVPLYKKQDKETIGKIEKIIKS
ncbi:M28 family peptidase [Lachnospiraceae bacterium ZAX-1]